MAVKSALGEAGFSVWDAWSQGAACHREKDARAAWKSFKDDGKVTAATLFFRARQAGWKGESGAMLPPPPPTPRPDREAAERAEKARHEAVA